MTHDPTHDDHVRRIAELIRGIRIAMITTVRADGSLHARPMAAQEEEFGGDLWFFTERETAKVDELAANPQVSVAFSDPSANRYVTLSGTASIVTDRTRVRELWSKALEAWFPQGPEDGSVVLLRIEPSVAHSWEGPSSSIVQAFVLAKALVTGQRADRDWKDSGDVRL